MCAAIQPDDTTAPAGAELRATVTAVVAPVTGAVSARYSGDLLRLVRTSGQISGSARLPAHPARPLVARRYREAASAVQSVCAALADTGPARPQSAVVIAGARLRLLARLETPAGPMLAGGAGASAVADMLSVAAGLRQLPGALSGAPPGWNRLPLLLRPPVAAVLLAGARLVLGGAAAGKLAGQPVFGGLTLADRPVEHAEGDLDDCGRTAKQHAIISSGRVTPLPAGTVPGIPLGRAVWSHEENRLTSAATFGLTLSGLPAAPRPDGTIELLACAEGLRRYYPDGHLQMACLAKPAGSAAAFLVGVRARPLSLLRAVTGFAGDTANTYLEHEITTPSLMLPSAGELARKCNVHISTL